MWPRCHAISNHPKWLAFISVSLVITTFKDSIFVIASRGRLGEISISVALLMAAHYFYCYMHRLHRFYAVIVAPHMHHFYSHRELIEGSAKRNVRFIALIALASSPHVEWKNGALSMRFYMNEPSRAVESYITSSPMHKSMHIMLWYRFSLALHSTRSNLSRAAPYFDLHRMWTNEIEFTFTSCLSLDFMMFFIKLVWRFFLKLILE